MNCLLISYTMEYYLGDDFIINTAEILTSGPLSEENIRKNVLPYYGLSNYDICSIKFKDTDKQRAVYKISNDEASYCLKKVYYNEADLLFVYSAVEWLYRNGINVPRILKTLSKDRFVSYSDMLFILTPWIEGTKCSYDNLSNVLDASYNLGKMHQKTKNFKPITGSNCKLSSDNILSSTEKHTKELLKLNNLAFKYYDKFSKAYLDYFEDNYKLAGISLSVASSIDEKALSTSLCHLDYVNKNIIFNQDNLIYIIDFDKCRIDNCYHDIGYFLRRLLKRDNTKWDLELAINSLNNYEKNHILTFDDYKAILVYLSFPQKYWKISKDYYNNISKCNKAAFLTLLQKSSEKSSNQIEFALSFAEYIENKFSQKIKLQ